MGRVLKWIFREILISAAAVTVYDAVTSENNYDEYNYDHSYNGEVLADGLSDNESDYIKAYFPDWELIESETNKEYFSNYKLSSDPVNSNDLFNTYLGEFQGKFSTLTLKESRLTEFSADTVFFDYFLLYENSELLKTGLAYYIHDQKIIEFEDESFDTANIYKIENNRNNKSYMYLNSSDFRNGEMLFLNSQPINESK